MTPAPSERLEARGRDLGETLRELFARGVEREMSEEAFDRLALEVFRYQVEAVPAYGAWVRNRPGGMEAVDDWSRIPPVPARAFRELPLVAGDPEGAEAVFRTSGTTGDGGTRGEHRVRDLGLYDAALLPNARAHLRPEGEEGPLCVLALLPGPGRRPDSSLVHMAGVLAREWDPRGGRFLADADWRLEPGSLQAELSQASAGEVPVLVLGTAFAFVHLIDRAEEGRWFARLPPGSRVMETGGFKGRSRSVARTALYRGISRVLGVPVRRIVNEYGMTELLSQFYEPILRPATDAGAGGEGDPAGVESLDGRHLVGPPWVRTRVLDPETLESVAPGRPGLLCHLDLANLHSVSAVLTEDLGIVGDGGFRVLGRNPGAEPRGCSLTMEEMLASGEAIGN